jgi:predicted nucleotidyltransferase
MQELLSRLQRVYESSIDYPTQDLSAEVWDKQGESYVMKPEVKDQILAYLKKYTGADLIDAAERILVVGSIGTNQAREDSDIDVHITPNNMDEWADEEKRKEVTRFFQEPGNIEFVGEHPLEVYIQTNKEQDTGFKSVAAYDVQKDEWLVGPTTQDTSFDPYEFYSSLLTDLKDELGDTDAVMAELKRDVIDYEVIKTAIQRLPAEQQQAVIGKMKSKLEEIENDVQELAQDKEEFREIRHGDIDQAKSDMDKTKEWQDRNAKFKFIQRYGYLKTLSDLEDMLKDNKIDDEEVDRMKDVLGVVSNVG